MDVESMVSLIFSEVDVSTELKETYINAVAVRMKGLGATLQECLSLTRDVTDCATAVWPEVQRRCAARILQTSDLGWESYRDAAMKECADAGKATAEYVFEKRLSRERN